MPDSPATGPSVPTSPVATPPTEGVAHGEPLDARQRDEDSIVYWGRQAEAALAEVTRLREALDDLRVPIEEALRHLDPDEGCGYRTYKRTWDNLRHALDLALAEGSDVAPTATCSLDGCGFTFPHFHRDTLDGEEVVRIFDAENTADVLPTRGAEHG